MESHDQLVVFVEEAKFVKQIKSVLEQVFISLCLFHIFSVHKSLFQLILTVSFSPTVKQTNAVNDWCALVVVL